MYLHSYFFFFSFVDADVLTLSHVNETISRMRDLHVWLWCVRQKRHEKCEKKIHPHRLDGRDRKVRIVAMPHKEFICSTEITGSSWTMRRPSADPVFDRKLTISKLNVCERTKKKWETEFQALEIYQLKMAYTRNFSRSRHKYVFSDNWIFCWSIWCRGPYIRIQCAVIRIHEIAAISNEPYIPIEPHVACSFQLIH